MELDRWGNRLLAALPSETLALLERDLKQVTLTQGAVCFEPGDSIDQIYFPSSGMISLLVTTGNGDMVETSTIGREGALGLQSGLGERQSFTRATVQVAGKFLTIAAAGCSRRPMAARYSEN